MSFPAWSGIHTKALKRGFRLQYLTPEWRGYGNDVEILSYNPIYSTLFTTTILLCLNLILRYSNRSEMQEFDRSPSTESPWQPRFLCRSAPRRPSSEWFSICSKIQNISEICHRSNWYSRIPSICIYAPVTSWLKRHEDSTNLKTEINLSWLTVDDSRYSLYDFEKQIPANDQKTNMKSKWSWPRKA